MSTRTDLSTFNWSLTGYTPTSWALERVFEQDMPSVSEFEPIEAKVPSSVQQSLFNAGKIPDWRINDQSKACEWVEHRDWIYGVDLPALHFKGKNCALNCLGLDGYGLVMLNSVEVGRFANGYITHRFDLSQVDVLETNRLEIIFNDLPRYNGSPHRSSEIRDLKVRFNYAWDWMPRNVQIGIWDKVYLDSDRSIELDELTIKANLDLVSKRGELKLKANIPADDQLKVTINGVYDHVFKGSEIVKGVQVGDLKIKAWSCNGQGESPLYDLKCEWINKEGFIVEVREEKIGFKNIEWKACEGAPAAADPWLCSLNGTSIFLAGVDWTPIRPYYADVSTEDYRKRLETYRDIGCNVLRVWGGAFLEKEIFYQLCDELGLLVWQEFPLSSSGSCNTPPSDEPTIEAYRVIAKNYIEKRRHHASLLMWCGGNELQVREDGESGIGLPLDEKHPMLKALGDCVREYDPGVRYNATSSQGPIFIADEKDFGKGIHWDVHGPWDRPADSWDGAKAYWDRDDALFRSEYGAPGASGMELIEKYYDVDELLPIDIKNPLWRKSFTWLRDELFETEHGRKAGNVKEYVEWSQNFQSRALEMGLKSGLTRFPKIGGMILWMGHDSYPCLSNTSILDFDGNMKPAAMAIQKVLNSKNQ